MTDDSKEVFRPRQKLQSGNESDKGSAFAIATAEAKLRADKTAKLKAARLAKEASEPKDATPPKTGKAARKA